MSGLFSKPKAPKAPDPEKVAAAQTKSNKDTALAQATLNNVSQDTPYGSVNYTIDGYDPKTGMPRYRATQSLSPEMQGLFDLNSANSIQKQQIAQNQLGAISNVFSKPFELSNEAAESRLMDLNMKRMDPYFDRESAKLEQNLADRGIKEGMAAYDNAKSRFNEGKNDQLNQLLLTGRGQAMNELMTERNQPINETNAFISGSQVQQPNFVNTPQTGVAGTDIAGITQQGYQNQLGAYNAQLANQNAMMGGLFGLGGNILAAPMTGGGSVAGAMLSDRRAKENIKEVGALHDGTKVYSYRYRWGGPTQIGVMAQEAIENHPDAIHNVDGLLMVDYGKIAEAQ